MRVAALESLRRTVGAGTLLLVVAVVPASAHEVRPGYLELREGPAASYEVVWKIPTRGGLRLPLVPVFPADCRPATPISSYPTPAAMVERFTLRCERGLIGRELAIDGLSTTLTDVLIRLEPTDGAARTVRLLPNAPVHRFPAEPSRSAVAGIYLRLGVEHILGGIDHLLFVLALLLIVVGWRALVATVTAFTVAHSITLALAVLGFVHVPQAPVEAVIALSILFLASEIAHARLGRRTGLAERRPWLVAFTFGLLHGFGFAGALSEIGLPESAIPLALLFFNLGVELGQLLFVAAAMTVPTVARRVELPLPAWGWRVPTYAIGTLAAYWTLDRVTGFWIS